MDFGYFEKKYRLIAADLSKQKALDSDSRAIQRIIFTGKTKAAVDNSKSNNLSNSWTIKETILQFVKGTTKVL